MKLQSKGARRTLGVVCSTAVVAAGASFIAAPADAATRAKSTLSISGSTGATVLDLGAAAAAGNVSGFNILQPLANATYAERVTSSITGTLKLSWDSYTVPTGTDVAHTDPHLYVSEVAAGGLVGPTADVDNGPWTQMAAPAGASVLSGLTGGPSVATKDVFIAPDEPGTYTFHFVDTGLNGGTDDDVVSSTITLTVLDVEGATAETTDDWVPGVSASASSTPIGAPVAVTVPFTSLTTTDSRGSSSGVGVLLSKLAALTGIKMAAGATGYAGTYAAAYAPVVAGTSTGTATIAPLGTTAVGTLTHTGYFDSNGSGTWTAADYALTVSPGTTGVTAATVDDVTMEPVTVSGTVGYTEPDVSAKVGTASVAYKATAKLGANLVSGAPVYFTLVNGTNAPTLSADGTLISSTTVGAVTTKVYRATSGSDGTATLTVTSGTTTAGTDYTVDAQSGTGNAEYGGGVHVLTTTYTAANGASATIADITSAAQQNPTVGTNSVTLSGTMSDAFGMPYTPTSTDTVQTVQVFINGAQAGTASVSAGKFSWTYTPSTTPVAGSSATYYFKWTATPSQTATKTIHWAAATTAGSVTLSSPSNGATGVATQDHNAPNGAAVAGAVLDANGAAIAYKIVKLSGSAGVLFSSTADGSAGLSSTLDAAADAAGQFSAFAFYTKTGSVTVTVTADDKSVSNTFTTADALDPYKVTIRDVAIVPGATATITGTVTDAFGNPTKNANVDLSAGSTALGGLANAAPVTNSGGVFSTTFATVDSTSTGTVTITATLNGQTTNATANAGWATGGVTVAAGTYTAQGTLTVDGDIERTTITGPSYRMGAGTVELSGHAKPGLGVEIYAKPSGTDSAYALVGVATADEAGNWTDSAWIARTSLFYAKTSVSSSTPITVTVKSANATVKLKGKVLGKGRTLLTIDGGPNVKGSTTLYVLSGRKYVKVKSWTSNAWGNSSIIVKTRAGYQTFRVVFAPYGYKAAGANLKIRVR